LSFFEFVKAKTELAAGTDTASKVRGAAIQ